MSATEELRDTDYLGDGVYVGHDGLHVVLWLEHTGLYGPDAIALDPGVRASLDDYIERVWGGGS